MSYTLNASVAKCSRMCLTRVAWTCTLLLSVPGTARRSPNDVPCICWVQAAAAAAAAEAAAKSELMSRSRHHVGDAQSRYYS